MAKGRKAKDIELELDQPIGAQADKRSVKVERQESSGKLTTEDYD